MSIESYERNLKRGVTGKHTSTCYTAACEIISPDHRIRARTHKMYDRFAEWWNMLDKNSRTRAVAACGVLYDQLAMDLGYSSWKQLVFKRVSGRWALEQTIENLIETDHRVVLEINVEGESHAVGLLPAGEGIFKLASTWLPKGLRGEVDYDQLYAYRDLSEDPKLTHFPFHDANITALPSMSSLLADSQ